MPQLWVIAVGFLFVALNFTINGVQLFLPTCFGFALIGFSCWSLRDDQRVFVYATGLAVVLTFLSFPEMFRVAVGGIPWFDDWLVWPRFVLEIALVGLVAFGYWCEANLRHIDWLRKAAIGTAAVVVISLITWWFFPIWNTTTFLISVLLESVPSFYLAGVSARAAMELG